jgi:hypothetical protein
VCVCVCERKRERGTHVFPSLSHVCITVLAELSNDFVVTRNPFSWFMSVLPTISGAYLKIKQKCNTITRNKFVRFEVITVVIMKNAHFWDVTLYGSCRNGRFGGTYRLYHQVDILFLLSVRRLLVTANVVPTSPILVTLMMEALVPPKRRFFS